MKIIPEVKCRRCGESYSSLRSSCPNCGTRKVSQSRRAPGTTPSTVKGTAAFANSSLNTRWQMIFGLILVVAVVLAVIVMVSTGLSTSDKKVTVVATPTPATETAEDGTPIVETPPTPTPTPTPSVERIVIRYYESEKTEFTMHVGDVITVNAFVTPATVTDPVTWAVTDDSGEYATIEVDPDTNYCTITCVGAKAGGVTLTATLAGVTASCQVYLAS